MAKLWQRIVGIVLVVFAVGSLVYSFMSDPHGHLQPYSPPSDGVVVYYFLVGTKRCDACHKVQTYTHKSVETYSAGKGVTFAVVNADADANRHFVKAEGGFNLAGKSVVVARYVGGKLVHWTNCKDIWTWIGLGEAACVAKLQAVIDWSLSAEVTS